MSGLGPEPAALATVVADAGERGEGCGVYAQDDKEPDRGRVTSPGINRGG